MKFSFSSLPAVIAAFVAVAAAQTAAHAHFIWATVENGQARFALLENIAESPSDTFTKYVANLSPHCGTKTLALGAPKSGARYATLPAGQTVVVAESVVGAKEREGEPYLLVYNAKGATTLAAAKTVTHAPAEIVAYRDGETLTITVQGPGGKPVPQNEVWVQWPGDAEPARLTTDDKGEAHTPWPAPATRFGGFVGIRAMVKEATAGKTSEGKAYASVHRWATLTFPVAGPALKPAAPATAAIATPPTGEIKKP